MQLTTIRAARSVKELDITQPMSLKLKRAGAAGFAGLATNPDELEDVFLVLHYKLS